MMLAVLFALAEPVGLPAVRALHDGDRHCVCDRMRRLDATQRRMSRHMQVLKQAGRVMDRRAVQWVAACMLKGIERIMPMLAFRLDGAEVQLEAIRQDAPPKLTLIRYQITLDSAETDQRLDLLHSNMLKYGTIPNTLAPAVPLEGKLTRKV